MTNRIKNSVDGKTRSWDELNDYFIELTDQHGTNRVQTMNLLTFVQMLGTKDVSNVELTMYTEKPDVVTFDLLRKQHDDEKKRRLLIANVSFMLDGTTLLTISDFQRRKCATFLNRVLLVPKYKKKVLYYTFRPLLVTYDLLELFIKIADDTLNPDIDTKQIEKYANDMLGCKAKHV